MPIDKELLRNAAERISEVEGVFMDPASLAEDVLLLAYAFLAEEDFMAACANTCLAMKRLVDGTVMSSSLKYGLEGWSCHHYQHRVGQGIKADCRIVFRDIDDGIEVKAFGHRRIPKDFYRRLQSSGR